MKYPMETNAAMAEGAILDLTLRLAANMLRESAGQFANMYSREFIDDRYQDRSPTEAGKAAAEFCLAAAQALIGMGEERGTVEALPTDPTLTEGDKTCIRYKVNAQAFAQKTAMAAAEEAQGKLAKVAHLPTLK